MACGKLMQLEDGREKKQDLTDIENFKTLSIVCESLYHRSCTQENITNNLRHDIANLNERIGNLEINDAYLMDWRVKHDNVVARKKTTPKKRKTFFDKNFK